MAKRWYAVHTYSGQEARVVEYITDLIAAGEMKDLIGKSSCRRTMSYMSRMAKK